jgi:hypothetical protein
MFLLYYSYALGVRKLVSVHHRAGYPTNSVKEKKTHIINKFIMDIQLC